MKVQFFLLSKRINSTKLPDNPSMELECQLKEPSDTVNPTIIISPYVKHGFNYVYIPNWMRYYFVNNINYTTGGRMEVELTTDYLATYRTSIASYSCFVERASSAYNPMIDDEYISNTEDQIYAASSSTTLNEPFETTVGSYFMRTINNNSGTNGITTYVLSEYQLGQVFSFMFTDGSYGDMLSDSVVKSFFNPFQYIVSLMWVPVRATYFANNPTRNVVFGWWDSGVAVKVVDHYYQTFGLKDLNVPENYYNDFRAFSSRFTKYSLYLPAIGNVDLSPVDAHAPNLQISLSMDTATGIGEYYIFKNLNGSEVATYKTQIGVPIQIAQMGSSLSQTLRSGTSAVTSAASGGILGTVIGGIHSLINTAKSVYQPTPSVIGTAGDMNSIRGNSIVCTVTCRGSGQYATSVAGRPLFETRQLSTLVGGFIKCGNASIDIGGYDIDKETVNNYLNSGFYLE